MKLETGDFVVAQLGDRELCEILSVQGATLRLLVCRTELLEEAEVVEVEDSVILANMGRTPLMGVVYNCKVEVALAVDEGSQFTFVQYAAFEDADVLEKKQKAMATAVEIVVKRGFYREAVTVHLVAGGDNANQAKDKWDSRSRVLTMAMLPYPLDHAYEVQRYLHSLLMPLWDILPGDCREQWLVQFAKSANIASYTREQVRAVLEWRRRYATTKLWLKDGADAEDSPSVYGLWLAYAKRFYRLSSNEAEAVLKREDWEDYLPDISISAADYEEQVTSIGVKNAMRFFCETLSLSLLGASLPPELAALCSATCSLNFAAVESNYKLALEEKASRRFVRDGEDSDALLRAALQNA